MYYTSCNAIKIMVNRGDICWLHGIASQYSSTFINKACLTQLAILKIKKFKIKKIIPLFP